MRSKQNKLHKESLNNSWFFENTDKIDKRLSNITKWRREKTQINKLRDEKGDITRNTNKIQRLIREYFQNLY
jgi:hypothetical protein